MYNYVRKKVFEPFAINKRKKRLKRDISSLTIISRNCIGGIIYHDLGLQFKSPIINMYIETKDFLLLCNDLMSFFSLDTTLVQKDDCNFDFPVGILTSKKGQSITLYFMHYDNFSSAKEKWYERCSRVNYNNILIIFEDLYNLNIDFDKMKNIPHKNTFFIIDKNQAKLMSGMDKNQLIVVDNKLQNGSDLFAYKMYGFSGYRRLDDLSYIERILNLC